MSEVVEPKSSGSSSRLKKMASSSTWTSPFRSQSSKAKNLHTQFQEQNSINGIHIPSKFTSHPTLEAEKKLAKKKAAAKKETEDSEPKESSETSEQEPEQELETTEQTSVDGTEKNPETAQTSSEATEAAPETEEKPEEKTATPTEELANDDNIKQLVKESPIELVVQPESKYEPTQLPNQEHLEKLQDKPVLLNRYQELNTTAIGSVSKSIDDPNKVIDLGSGLKLTQQQLLDIAATRIAPVIALINEEVNKTRNEDEIKRQKELAQKVANHEKKLDKEFDKHVKKLTKTKEKFTKEIEKKLEDLTRLMKNADIAAANFKKQTEQEIETANEDFKTREVNAVEQHGADKETLLKNHDELLATKNQELEDAKTNQETTTQEIEELQEKKTQLDNTNSELSTKIDELQAELNAKVEELDELKTKYEEKQSAISKNLSTKEELDEKISTSEKGVSEKQATHDSLKAEIGVLAGTLTAYSTKLAELHNDKELRKQRLTDAKEHYATWEKEKDELAKEVAKDHERQRLEAQHAAETKKFEEELERQRLKEEAERKRQEEEEEKARLKAEAEKKRQEEEEEKARLKAEAEKKRQEEAEEQARLEEEAKEKKVKQEKDDKLAKEQQEWEEKERLSQVEAERKLNNDPEHQRQLRIEKREAEQKRLLEEKAEHDRIYNERKLKEEEESKKLQAEIEELRNQKTLNAEAEKKEAEKLAQLKLLEIEKLKDEHKEKLALYKQRVEFEELQKTRLIEEVENLKKIRHLKEEKARLANEVNVGKDAELENIQKLIEEREIEVTRLSRQIEYDDKESSDAVKNANAKVSASIVPINDSVPDKVGKDELELAGGTRSPPTVHPLPAITESKKERKISSPVADLANKEKKSDPSGKKDIERSGSLTNKFKKFTNKFKSKDDKPAKSKKAGTTPKQSSDDVETYSLYEEVSDGEYEANKHDPNYFEVSLEEFAQHNNKAKNLKSL